MHLRGKEVIQPPILLSPKFDQRRGNGHGIKQTNKHTPNQPNNQTTKQPASQPTKQPNNQTDNQTNKQSNKPKIIKQTNNKIIGCQYIAEGLTPPLFRHGLPHDEDSAP